MAPLRPASPQSRARRGRREEEGRGRGWQVGPGAKWSIYIFVQLKMIIIIDMMCCRPNQAFTVC